MYRAQLILNQILNSWASYGVPIVSILQNIYYISMGIHFTKGIWWWWFYNHILPSNLLYKTHLSRQVNCLSLRCSWSIACRRCSNYIFILDSTPGFIGLGRDNFKTRWESFKFWDLVPLVLEILQYNLLCVRCVLYSRVWSASIGVTRTGAVRKRRPVWTASYTCSNSSQNIRNRRRRSSRPVLWLEEQPKHF